MPDTSDTTSGFLKGATATSSAQASYVLGATVTLADIPAYLYGGGGTTDSISAFVSGTGDLLRSSIYAYINSVTRSTISGFIEGTNLYPGDEEMAEYDHIWLKTSDLSDQFKFRVLAQGYDDGTLEKAEDIKRTIGGGLDYSVGAVYKSWNPIIRVRALEPETNYGSLQDLIDLYNLNNPGGTPTNVLTFTDHHGTDYSVYMVGSFRKQLMGVKIEGSNAWSLVKLTLVEIP